MKKIEIFDPAMCCSTGVCGPSVDSELIRISVAVNNLKNKGIDVTRYNLASERMLLLITVLLVSYLMDKGPGCVTCNYSRWKDSKRKSSFNK
jgi:hypothetical protein